MQHVNTIFHQLLRHIPRHRFEAVVRRHEGDRRVRTLSCWTQFTVMLFAQLSGRSSLRDTIESWDSHSGRHYHLGGSRVRRSTLADANSARPYQIYTELFHWLLARSRTSQGKSREMVRLIDSTTIDLCKTQFEWARFRSGKAGVKIHTVFDPAAQTPTFFSITEAKCHDRKAARELPLLAGATYVFDRAYNDYAWFSQMHERDIRFVTRMKSNARFEIAENREAVGDGVLEDSLIRLDSDRYSSLLRRIRFLRVEDGKELVFITNDLERSAGQIADLYKQRWQIELFFRWIKQNLRIKTFFGTSENAVKTQIIVAMIAYLLLHMSSKIVPNPKTLQQLARLVTSNLMHRKSILQLLIDAKPPNPPTHHRPHPQQQLSFA